MYNSDFKCSKCDEIFEKIYYAKEKEKEIPCPFCQSLMEKLDVINVIDTSPSPSPSPSPSDNDNYDTPKACECEDWKDNIRILNNPYTLNLAVVGHYKGKIFDYCPWCGERLK